jgi:hypothetical protein
MSCRPRYVCRHAATSALHVRFFWGGYRRWKDIIVADGDESAVVEEGDEHEHEHRQLPRAPSAAA